MRNSNRRVGSVRLDLLCAFRSIDRELHHFQNPLLKWVRRGTKRLRLQLPPQRQLVPHPQAILP
jgi:hypothetical protein